MPPAPLAAPRSTAAVLGVPVGWVTRAAWGLPTALGAHRRRLRPLVAGSPHWSEGKFHNTLETPRSPRRTPATACCGSGTRSGTSVCPAARSRWRRRVPAEAAELAVTWLGHASALLEIDGQRVLVDPVWGFRVSPSPVFGPTRLHRAADPAEGRSRRSTPS